MTCCHYDEGYDDGRAEAIKEATPSISITVEALRIYAEERDARADFERADLARELADEMERDPWLDRRLAYLRRDEDQKRAAA